MSQYMMVLEIGDVPYCGMSHDRDQNAASNIERQGVVALGLGGVSPALPATAA